MNTKQFENLCSEIALQKRRIMQIEVNQREEERVLAPISNLMHRVKRIEPALKDDQLIEIGLQVGRFLNMVAASVRNDPCVQESVRDQATRATGMYARRAFQHRKMRARQ